MPGPNPDYDVTSLENLWHRNGGAADKAQFAAAVGMVESGGRSWIVSPTGDVGLWQINIVHGAQASKDPDTNAKAAIALSKNGTDWRLWSTCWTGNAVGVGEYLGDTAKAVQFYKDLAGNAVASSTINSFKNVG